MISRVCRRLSQWSQNLVIFMVSFGKMRRVLTRVLSRVLLKPPFTPVMETEAQLHTKKRKLVVGLGNPGMDGTRHNVGWAVLDSLADRLGVLGRWSADRQLTSELNLCEVDGQKVILLKPILPMNFNGVAVAKAVSKFGVRPEDVLLVHDELQKPLGKVTVKHGGSARGHRGVRSCIDCLDSDVMIRLRVGIGIGIGRPMEKSVMCRFVLDPFSAEEKKILVSVQERSVDLLLSLLRTEEGAVEPGRHKNRRQKVDKPETATVKT